jgi:Ni,Fe-hydrogenase I large subunit
MHIMKQCEIKKGAIIINTEISSLEERGIERILDRSPMDVDILHNIEPKSGRLLDYV